MAIKTKKNAKLNFLQLIFRYFGRILPIIIVIIITSFSFSIYLYFQKQSELQEKKEEYETLSQKLNKYKGIKNDLLSYGESKSVYNDYYNSQLNYPLIFKTIESFIPKDSSRSSLKVKKKNNKIIVGINTEIEGYDSYMSMLRIIDKCNFTTEKQKESLLNISKIELSKKDTGEDKLGETANVNLNFEFDTVNNKYLLLKKYEQKFKEFQDIGKFIYFIDISKNSKKYPDKKQGDYFKYLKEFYLNKKSLTRYISKILKTDDNGFYLVDSGENFMKKVDTETEFTKLLIKYWDTYINQLTKNRNKIFDSGDIILETKNKKEIVFNLKENINQYLSELNKKKLKLELIRNYNEYLKQGNYLDTFKNIKSKPSEKYVVTIDGEEKEISASDYITFIIDNYDILKEDDPILEKVIIREKSTIKDGETVFTEKTDEEIEKEKKAIYTEMINFLKNIDTEKEKLLNANTYLDEFYKYDTRYNLYREGVIVLDTFFNKAKLNIDFLNNIKYPFFNFKVSSNINTYKRQFILTIKNNKKLLTKLNKIKTDLKSKDNKLEKELKEVEDFILKTDNVILAKNNNINCIVKDIKKETKTIYNTLLKDRQDEDEKKSKIKEVDLIIKEMDEKINNEEKVKEEDNKEE